MNIETLADEFFDYITTAMAGVPAPIKTKLRDTMRPRYYGYGGLAMAVEIIYRNKDILPVALLNLGAKLAETADETNTGGMNIDRRGFRIGAAIRKLPGVEAKPAPSSVDPDVLDVGA